MDHNANEPLLNNENEGVQHVLDDTTISEYFEGDFLMYP